jgi:transposase
VSLERSSLCAVDTTGRIVRGGKVPSEPGALVAFLQEVGALPERVGLEGGPLSQWLHAGLVAAGWPPVLIKTRHVRAALKAMTMTTDRNDARGSRISCGSAGTATILIRTSASMRRR